MQELSADEQRRYCAMGLLMERTPGSYPKKRQGPCARSIYSNRNLGFVRTQLRPVSHRGKIWNILRTHQFSFLYYIDAVQYFLARPPADSGLGSDLDWTIGRPVAFEFFTVILDSGFLGLVI